MSVSYQFLGDLVKKRATVATVLTEPGTIQDGDVIVTEHYGVEGDGGGNSYYLRDGSTVKPRPVEFDGGWTIDLDGSRYWLEVIDKGDFINPAQFGARPRSVDSAFDSTTIFQQCIDLGSPLGSFGTADGRAVKFRGFFNVERLTLPAGTHLIGDGPEKAGLYATDASSGAYIQDEGNGVRINFDSFTVYGNSPSHLREGNPNVTSVFDLGLVSIQWGTGSRMRDCGVRNFPKALALNIDSNISFIQRFWTQGTKGVRIIGNGHCLQHVQVTGPTATKPMDITGKCNLYDIEIEATGASKSLLRCRGEVNPPTGKFEPNLYGALVTMANSTYVGTATAATNSITMNDQLPHDGNRIKFLTAVEGLDTTKAYWVLNRTVTNSYPEPNIAGTFQVTETYDAETETPGPAVAITGDGAIEYQLYQEAVLEWDREQGEAYGVSVDKTVSEYDNFMIGARTLKEVQDVCFKEETRLDTTVEKFRIDSASATTDLRANQLAVSHDPATLHAVFRGTDTSINVKAARVPLEEWQLEFDGSTTEVVGRDPTDSEMPTTNPFYTHSFICDPTTDSAVGGSVTYTGDYALYFDFVNNRIVHKPNNNPSAFVAWAVDEADQRGLHHWTVRRNGAGDTFALFRDGVLNPNKSISGSINDFSSWLSILGRTGTSLLWFTGKIQEARSWNVSLNDTDVADDFAGDIPQRDKLVLDWQIAEAAGTVVTDYSGLDRTGTLAGDNVDAGTVWLTAVPASVVTPEEFGAVGDGVTDDTAAVTAALNSRVTNIVMNQDYLVSDTCTVTGKSNFTVSGNGTLKQTGVQKKTLEFNGCTHFDVNGLTLVGLGTDGDWSTSSWNNVAGIHLLNCSNATISGNTLSNHAGGGVRFSNTCSDITVTNNRIAGMGRAQIAIDDNGSDVAIGTTGILGLFNRISVTDNIISGHAFGTSFGRATSADVIIHDNFIYDIPGQHGIYADSLDKISICGNIISNTALIGIKLVESLGDPRQSWTVSNNTLLDCFSNITVGRQGVTRMLCRGVVITDNNLLDNGGNTLGHPPDPATPNPVKQETTGIVGIDIYDGVISGNVIKGMGAYGMQLSGFSGQCNDNLIKECGWDGVLLYLNDDTEFNDNVITDAVLDQNQRGPATGRYAYLETRLVAGPENATPAFYCNNLRLKSTQTETTVVRAFGIYDANIRAYMTKLRSEVQKGWEFLAAPIQLDWDYAPFFDHSSEAAAWVHPAIPIAGRGRRIVHGTQDPAAAGMTDRFLQGDFCWNTRGAADAVLGWRCVTSGAPGTWTAIDVPQIVRPELFGAVGDGVADDADAISSALATGKKVVLSAGKTYQINRTVELSSVSNQEIVIEGTLRRHASTWTPGTDDVLLRMENCSGVRVSGAQNVTTFDGNAASGTSAFRGVACVGCTVEDVTVDNMGAAGVIFFSGTANTVKSVRVKNIHQDGSSSGGVAIVSENGFTVDGVQITDSPAKGVAITGTASGNISNISHINATYFSAADTGLYLSASGPVNCSNVICKNVNIKLSQDSLDCAIDNAYVITDGYWAFYAQGATDTRVANSRFVRTASIGVPNPTAGACYIQYHTDAVNNKARKTKFVNCVFESAADMTAFIWEAEEIEFDHCTFLGTQAVANISNGQQMVRYQGAYGLKFSDCKLHYQGTETVSTVDGTANEADSIVEFTDTDVLNNITDAMLTRDRTLTVTLNATDNTVLRTAHTYREGQRGRLTSTGALPPELKTNVLYYVVDVQTDTFKLALSPGGTPLTFSTNGSGIIQWLTPQEISLTGGKVWTHGAARKGLRVLGGAVSSSGTTFGSTQNRGMEISSPGCRIEGGVIYGATDFACAMLTADAEDTSFIGVRFDAPNGRALFYTNSTTNRFLDNFYDVAANHTQSSDGTANPGKPQQVNNKYPNSLGNFYEGDGTLSDARTVTMGANKIDFVSTGGSFRYDVTGNGLVQLDAGGAHSNMLTVDGNTEMTGLYGGNSCQIWGGSDASSIKVENGAITITVLSVNGHLHLNVPQTGAMVISGSSGGLDDVTGPLIGYLKLNTTTGNLEFHNGTAIQVLSMTPK